MSDSRSMERTITPAGTFTSDWQTSRRSCTRCDLSGPVQIRTWESDCGGFQDAQWRCSACRSVWWIDGPDA